MTKVYGLRIGGKGVSFAGLPLGVIPGPVVGLAAGTPTSTTIPLTYTAPTTGTAPISYSAFYRAHGATAWLPASGTFGATGGTITGLTAATSYDARITATNGYGSSNTDLTLGILTAAAPAATDFIVGSPSPASGSSGSTFTVAVSPVGNSWGAGITVAVPTVTGATCSNASQTATAGATTPVTFNFTSTGAAGSSVSITVTATGMTNDTGPVSFSIVASGGTVPATLTIASMPANQLFSRDANAETGNPAGSPSTFNLGWATVPFVITPSAAVSGASLLMRLRDRDNPGTVLVDWTATGVTSLVSGVNLVPVKVPAAPYLYLADFGFSGSQSTYASTPNAFAPGYLVLYSGPSICSNSLGTVAGNSNADISSYVTFNNKTFFLSTGSNSPTGKWITAGDSSSTYVALSALGLNREFADKGIPIGFIDTSLLGQGIEPYDLEGQSYTGNAITQALQYVGLAYGSPAGNELFNVSTYGRIDALCIDGYNGSASQSQDYYASEMASLYKGVVGLVDKPFDFVVGFQEYTGGENYDRKVKEILVSKIPRAHMYWDKNWPGSAPNGHPGQAYKAYHQGVNWVQARRVARGTSSEPPLIVSATRAAGSADIYLTIANNLTALGGWQAVTPGGGDVGMTVTSDATSAQLATMFSLLAPGSQDVPGPTFISATACTLVNATQIKLTFPDTLSGRPQSGDNDFDLLHDVYIANYNSQDIISVRDNVLDAGTPYGRALQQTLTPVYVPKPSAPAAAITLSAISGLSTGISIRALALTAATGTWTGTSVPTSIDFSVDGGAYATSVDTHILSNGTWRATFLAPAVGASHTLQARITSGSAVSGSLSFATTTTDYPAGAVADLDIRLLGNLFKDAGRTQAAAHLDRLNGYTDPTGNGAHFQQYTGRGAPGPRFLRNLALCMPAVHSQASFYNYHNFYPPTGYPDFVSTALPGLITGSFTAFFTALKPNTGGGGVIIGGKPTNANGYSFLMGIGAGAYVAVQPNNGGSTVQASSPTDLSGKMVHAVARCDVTNNVIKIKTYGETEATATGMPSGAHSWVGVDIGYGGIGGDNNARASIYRVGFYPGLLSDTDVNALLATSFRLYGA